jgi:hypothetical protein
VERSERKWKGVEGNEKGQERREIEKCEKKRRDTNKQYTPIHRFIASSLLLPPPPLPTWS